MATYLLCISCSRVSHGNSLFDRAKDLRPKSHGRLGRLRREHGFLSRLKIWAVTRVQDHPRFVSLQEASCLEWTTFFGDPHKLANSNGSEFLLLALSANIQCIVTFFSAGRPRWVRRAPYLELEGSLSPACNSGLVHVPFREDQVQSLLLAQRTPVFSHRTVVVYSARRPSS